MGSEIDEQIYPQFDSVNNINLLSNFREQIIFLFFNLTRKVDNGLIEKIAVSFREVLLTLKKELLLHREKKLPDSEFIYMEILETILKLIANLRDVLDGKGEHELYYMTLFELYRCFPTLAVFLLYQTPTYGCWRDIKYLCQYIREHSIQNKEDSFIHICIHLMNSQLKKDLEKWKFSVHAGSRNHISNIAKWIPREKKKFNWLFELLAIHWSNNYSRWKINMHINDPSYSLAFTKCKMNYRKIISKMNKNLNTTEIKQCSQSVDEINPYYVSKYTFMKQPTLLAKLNYLGKNANVDNPQEFNMVIQLPVSYFVKEAYRLLKSNKTDAFYSDCELLNAKWISFSKIHDNYGFGKILPIVDVSYKMLEHDAEPFYTGIGLAILVAEYSKLGKRILTIDNNPTWINLEGTTTFFSMVQIIYDSINSQQNTAFSFERGINLLVIALYESKYINSTVKFVFFSNQFHAGFLDSYYKYIETQFLSVKRAVPKIIFWNLSKRELCELLPEYSVNKVILLSGYSSYLLKYLSVERNDTAYDVIFRILNRKRYELLSSYLKQTIQC